MVISVLSVGMVVNSVLNHVMMVISVFESWCGWVVKGPHIVRRGEVTL